MSRGPQPMNSAPVDQPVKRPVLVSEDYTITKNNRLSVDTSSGPITITVSSSPDLDSFIVFDRNQSFSQVNTCTVSLGGSSGNVVLQASGDYLEFYSDDNGGWNFIDHGRSKAGVV